MIFVIYIFSFANTISLQLNFIASKIQDMGKPYLETKITG